jgi:DNA-binding response OmpR family regulator
VNDVTPAQQGVVLIVEDEPSTGELLADALSEQGYMVERADTGARAITLLEQYAQPARHLGLVLLDMMLPEIDGFTVLEHLARLDRYVPVVAMSASHGHLQSASRAGAQALLHKPFDVVQLLATVERHCARGYGAGAAARPAPRLRRRSQHLHRPLARVSQSRRLQAALTALARSVAALEGELAFQATPTSW